VERPQTGLAAKRSLWEEHHCRSTLDRIEHAGGVAQPLLRVKAFDKFRAQSVK
jgi:hypothetical protein